jgi:hypothetical protein
MNTQHKVISEWMSHTNGRKTHTYSYQRAPSRLKTESFDTKSGILQKSMSLLIGPNSKLLSKLNFEKKKLPET